MLTFRHCEDKINSQERNLEVFLEFTTYEKGNTMLIEFTVGNYRSFSAPMMLTMQATPLRDNEEIDRQNIFVAGKLSLLRSAAIYGANASGKSNLVHAMMFMREFVLNSVTKLQSGEPTGAERFALNTAAREEPASFQIVFLIDGIRYRYGYELDEERVLGEWLYRTVKKETRLFVREGKNFDISTPFKKEAGSLQRQTRENSLFLSVLAQFNSPIAIALLDWFRNKFHGISGLNDQAYGGYTLHRFETEENFRQRVREMMRMADVGITDLSIKKIPFDNAEMPEEVRDIFKKIAQREGKTESQISVTKLETIHPIYEGEQQVDTANFELSDQESEGTQKLFFLLGPLFDTLENGNVLFIDELEARLHPLLTREIVRLFNSLQTNPHNAQLIFATHDAGLLGECLLRRDQIWFTEKNRYGATELYSLAEMKERNDASFDKNYLAGRYGATPYLGGLRALMEQQTQYGETIEA